MPTITYANGARIRITKSRTMLIFSRHYGTADGNSTYDLLADKTQMDRIAAFTQDHGGTWNSDRSGFPADQTDAVIALANELWGAPTDTGGHAMPEQPEPSNDPQAELIPYDSSQGPFPWNENRDEYWFAGNTWYRRTAHAHAVGRALLAHLRSTRPDLECIHVYECDGHIGIAPLATIADPTPVRPELEQFERDLEAAKIAKRRLDEAVQRMIPSMMEAYHGADEDSPNYRSANQIAAMVKGVMSRPTVLKTLRVYESEADL
jgi:hypothetical protein